MNTKKFIKKVNELDSYNCALDEDDRNCFFVQENNNNAIFIDTSLKEMKHVDSYYYLACSINTDAKLLSLLAKYANLKGEWHFPKKKWFKK